MDGVWIPPACLVVVGDAADSLSGHAKVECSPVCALLVIIFTSHYVYYYSSCADYYWPELWSMWMCCILLRELFPVLLVYGVFILVCFPVAAVGFVLGCWVWCLLLPVVSSIVVVCFVSLFILQELSF